MPVTKADLEKKLEELQQRLTDTQKPHRNSQKASEALLHAKKARVQVAEKDVEELRLLADKLCMRWRSTMPRTQ